MYSQQIISELKAQKESLFEQIKHIDAILSFSGADLSESKIGSEVEPDKHIPNCPYKKGSSYQEKIALIFNQEKRLLSVNEMAELVIRYEPNISIEDAKKALSSAKSLLLKDGVIVKYQAGTHYTNTFYGSPTWLDEEGKPKTEFMYDEKAVKVKKTFTI
jgi:regulator of replication initiation timing